MKGWTELCKHPEPAIALVVWEFYSNLYGEQDGTIFLQGIWASFEKKRDQ